MKKLFGGINLTWKRLIVFSIITAIYTALMAIIPITKETSFRDIAIMFEWLILWGCVLVLIVGYGILRGGLFGSSFSRYRSLEGYNLNYSGELYVSYFYGTKKGDVTLIPHDDTYTIKISGLNSEKYTFEYYFDEENNTLILNKTN